MEHENEHEPGNWSETSPSGMVAEAQNFDQLYAAIDLLTAGLAGTKQTFSPEDLKRIIGDVRSGHTDVNDVTRTAGLRVKVIELLGKESSSKS